jgi:metal-sulfur cluster biosynthetic enzyme
VTPVTRDDVLAALREVVDPEVGINVVDLGLVYGVEVEDSRVRVRMTMTSPACPLGVHLTEEAASRIRRRAPGVGDVRVELVWDPPWHPGLMSEGARRALG